MNHLKFLVPLVGAVLLAGCAGDQPSQVAIDQNPASKTASSESLFWSRKSDFSYATKMQKPAFDALSNKDEVQQETFNKPWTRQYQLTQQDIDQFKENIKEGYCKGGFGLSPEFWDGDVKLRSSDLQVGKSFSVTGKYSVHNYSPLTWALLAQVKKHGFWISEITREYLNPEYKEGYDDFFSKEERVRRIQEIGGSQEAYERAPFNTLLVTDDLLLHTFHKIFSNELQYFEESQARLVLAKLSETLFKKFQLWSNTMDPFLAAYWTIPHALLPSNEELLELFRKRESTMRDNYDHTSGKDPHADFDDEELKAYLTKRFEKLVKQVKPEYQEPLRKVWTEIWKAEQPKAPDYLMLAYSPEFIQANAIEQDYTQFRPRSHYTNSSFLKSYFMAMKWLMREKFYFWDQKLAETALHLVNSIPDTDLKELSQLQNAILTLIWKDDDATIQDLKSFITQQNGKITGLSAEQLQQLAQLGTQKIISTSYTTPAVWSTDEANAKDMTRGFVFFGEKFTLDSYIFDQLTAGSAEKEFLQKPNVQTAMIVPDVLENYAPAHELVKLRLQEKSRGDDAQVRENVSCDLGTCKQLGSYDQVKAQAQEKVKAELKDESLLKTVYHSWLEMLGQLFVKVKNLPYFKESPLYALKSLATYMGSYTELKHDTLLYVKQAYAELGGGGDDPCYITVYPPELPVPKGYIESDVNFIDKMIALNQSAQQWFNDADNFKGFGEYLQKIRNLSLRQMQNQKISDEEFEDLRLSYDELAKLTTPRKLFWEAPSKEERGALIADIFTSEGGNPLYEAIGRPMLMALMVNDVNGARIVMGPVFAHYEFYKSDNVLEGEQRYSDNQRQEAYDGLTSEMKQKYYGIEQRKLLQELAK